MPTHALLGATGATGSAVLRHILSSHHEGLCLNVFVRSKIKLLAAFPNLLENSPCSIQIFSAELSDKLALTACLRDAEVIYNCVATNISARGTNVASSAAEAIVAALQQLHEEERQGPNPPLVLVNRSMALNPALSSQAPKVVESVAMFALGYLFADLIAACEVYRSAAQEQPALYTYTFVDPPGLHDAEGTKRTGYELIWEGGLSRSLNYADLGAAFVEIAGRRDEFAGEAIGVSATGEVRESPGVLIGYLLKGLWSRLSPF